jgi:hypothetical protein
VSLVSSNRKRATSSCWVWGNLRSASTACVISFVIRINLTHMPCPATPAGCSAAPPAPSPAFAVTCTMYSQLCLFQLVLAQRHLLYPHPPQGACCWPCRDDEVPTNSCIRNIRDIGACLHQYDVLFTIWAATERGNRGG